MPCKADRWPCGASLFEGRRSYAKRAKRQERASDEAKRQEASGPWAACDAYELKRRERCPVARKELEYTYYIKFAIGMTGKILLLVSCHLSN
jgi:hypothetical protein